MNAPRGDRERIHGEGLRALSPAQLAGQLSGFYQETFQREYVETERALELLAASRDLLLELDGIHKHGRNGSPRYYLQFSERKAGGEGTYPVAVVLALIPDADAVRPFVVWFMVYPPEEQGPPFTVEGDYCETLREALDTYTARCAQLDLDPWSGTP